MVESLNCHILLYEVIFLLIYLLVHSFTHPFLYQHQSLRVFGALKANIIITENSISIIF